MTDERPGRAYSHLTQQGAVSALSLWSLVFGLWSLVFALAFDFDFALGIDEQE
ncbi:hypothetical protein TUM4438_44630 [Shewanella sairae]|uniref:Uncharacterized protein n=1 Tax=Shewanella sairae TaxID=190310 RepID=A0ABQ4PS33_9GAMM|nr:hypothetical protein [Shewanella sairae]MCL1132272.1 hypothetical protein [Shewanella sairae]GIU52292.1 hypothetical protein TUM4438_44630 [Shewanella sairae]